MRPDLPARRLFWLLPVAVKVLLMGCCPQPADIDLRFNVGAPATPVNTQQTPVFQARAVFESIPGKAGSHAPTIVAFPDGALLAAWYSYEGPGELDGASIYLARRPPGSAWGAPYEHTGPPPRSGNPVLYAEGDATWLFYAVAPGGWSTAHIEVQRSYDRGQTWSAPATIAAPLGANVRHPPLRTAEGELLLPAYDDLLSRSLFFASHDGEGWTLRAAVCSEAAQACLQPSATALADGRLLAVMRNAGGGWLWVAASDDSGRSWSRPADSGFPNPGSPALLLRLRGGNLLLIYNDSNTHRRPLAVTISADQGATWSPARVLADGTGAYAYPAATQTPDGLIHVLYSDDRVRIAHVTINEAWIVAGADSL